MNTQSITIDNITYSLDQFSPALKQAVEIYEAYSADAKREELALLKTKAAMGSLTSQISEAVKKELAEKGALVADFSQKPDFQGAANAAKE